MKVIQEGYVIKIGSYSGTKRYEFPKGHDSGLYSSYKKAEQYANKYLYNYNGVEIVKAKIIVEE